MATQRKRFTLDLEPAFQRRLKARAALMGVSMRQYCIDAVATRLDADNPAAASTDRELDGFEALFALRDEIWAGKPLQEDSTELIRQMREERARHLERVSRS